MSKPDLRLKMHQIDIGDTSPITRNGDVPMEMIPMSATPVAEAASQLSHNNEAHGRGAVISLDNIHKTYLLGLEGVPALRGVSLNFDCAEWVVIYGTSGGGKTSLLNIIGTIDKPTRGEMTICGTTVTPETTDDELAAIRLEKLGFVFQTFNLLSSMTARENVELPMMLKAQLSSKERTERAIRGLEQVGLGHRLDHFPAQLSGGEQQRVTIARAIANSPQVLLLDEPTGDLDSANTYRVISMLNRLNSEQKMTLIMVTHDVYLKNFAHRIVYMRDGKVAREERVDPALRAHALLDLQSKLALSVLDAQTHVAAQPSRASSDRVSGPTNGMRPPSSGVSEFRSPADYPTYCSAGLADAIARRRAAVGGWTRENFAGKADPLRVGALSSPNAVKSACSPSTAVASPTQGAAMAMVAISSNAQAFTQASAAVLASQMVPRCDSLHHIKPVGPLLV